MCQQQDTIINMNMSASKSLRRQRRVRFSLDSESSSSADQIEVQVPQQSDTDTQPDTQSPPEPQQLLLTRQERKELWYSKAELRESRRDMKRTIIAIHEQGGIDLLYTYEHGQEQLCVRGCERYYSMHGRSQHARILVQAVLEAQHQARGESKPSCLREVSKILSQSDKALAAWYAKLNAIDCWGQQEHEQEQQQQEEQPLQVPRSRPLPRLSQVPPLITTTMSFLDLPSLLFDGSFLFCGFGHADLKGLQVPVM